MLCQRINCEEKNENHRIKDWGTDRTIDPLPVVSISKIGGKIICGKRLGFPFTNVTRPQIETGVCPEGTTPCSNATAPLNTICYPLERHDLCPVTQIFIANEAQGIDLKNNEAYTVLDLIENDSQNRFLVYSKLQDNPPIVKTAYDL